MGDKLVKNTWIGCHVKAGGAGYGRSLTEVL